MNTVTLYRPCNQAELDLVAASGFKRWPPRLPEQPIFYPVSNEAYAHEVNRWNLTQFGGGYVTRFEVQASFMEAYPLKIVGASHHSEWWVPAGDLEALNDHIVGLIEVIARLPQEEDHAQE